MKFEEITKESVSKISDKELINLHYRLHQQYGRTKSDDLKKKHKIIITEMARRAKMHKSPMLIKTLNSLCPMQDKKEIKL